MGQWPHQAPPTLAGHPAPAAGSENTSVTKGHVGPPGRHVKADDPLGWGRGAGQQTRPSRTGPRTLSQPAAAQAVRGRSTPARPRAWKGPSARPPGPAPPRASGVLSPLRLTPCTLQPDGLLQDPGLGFRPIQEWPPATGPRWMACHLSASDATRQGGPSCFLRGRGGKGGEARGLCWKSGARVGFCRSSAPPGEAEATEAGLVSCSPAPTPKPPCPGPPRPPLRGPGV